MKKVNDILLQLLVPLQLIGILLAVLVAPGKIIPELLGTDRKSVV